MAIGFILEFAGTTSDQYDRTLARLELGGKLPSGGRFHIAGPTDDGFRVVDVWESQEDFDRFFEEKLHAALEAEGMPVPNISTWPVHNTMTG